MLRSSGRRRADDLFSIEGDYSSDHDSGPGDTLGADRQEMLGSRPELPELPIRLIVLQLRLVGGTYVDPYRVTSSLISRRSGAPVSAGGQSGWYI
jgi:hypothetical protein